MDELLPPPPPSPPPPSAVPTPAERGDVDDVRWLRHPIALFLVAAGVAFVTAGAVGGGVGLVIATIVNDDCAPGDGWCGLGGFIAGVFTGAVAAIVTYVTAGVAFIVRHRPVGARAAHIAAHLLAPVVIPSIVGACSMLLT